MGVVAGDEHADAIRAGGGAAGSSTGARGGGSDAPALLMKAPKQLEPLDGGLARRTFLDACLATAIAGRFADAGDLHEVARAARSARSARPPAGVPGPSDRLLDGLVVLVTEGRPEAVHLCWAGQRGSLPTKRSRARSGCRGRYRP